ncbi:hypothetical protein [Shimia ponticola]|uniref:hypothetical protein n=1 Tax=Shimia ponticola TaxID=2582893 RepID=UPI0011BE1C66|nr:hypothetical protein [Shimia ponticola]
MHILDIIIQSQRISEDGTSVVGKVTFSIRTRAGKSRQICMDCHTRLSKRIRPDALLISDAIRQLRRMPEIRSGTERLSFAKGMNPLRNACAA